jgi:hypothetical protein
MLYSPVNITKFFIADARGSDARIAQSFLLVRYHVRYSPVNILARGLCPNDRREYAHGIARTRIAVTTSPSPAKKRASFNLTDGVHELSARNIHR